MPVADRYILEDIDTPEQYRQLLQHYEQYDIPDDEECAVICRDICSLSPEIISHGKMVARVSLVIGHYLELAGISVDLSLVRASAWLHDIAKGQPEHDIAGGRLLHSLGSTALATSSGCIRIFPGHDQFRS